MEQVVTNESVNNGNNPNFVNKRKSRRIIPNNRFLDLNGNTWNKPSSIAPIIYQPAKGEFYFNDEGEQAHGPYSTLEEAVKGFNEYGTLFTKNG